MKDSIDARVYAEYLLWLAFTADPAPYKCPRYYVAERYFIARGYLFEAGSLL